MPRKGIGVYKAKNGTWFFKAWIFVPDDDGGEGRWKGTTRRGFHTSIEARRVRRQFIEQSELDRAAHERRPARERITVVELIDRYLAEATSMGRLSVKTLFDYRNYFDSYIVPHLGAVPADELTRNNIADWQLTLSERGSVKSGGPLAANTIRLARAPLNGALKYAIRQGLIDSNPMTGVSPPRKPRKIPANWIPDQARHFLAMHEGERLYPVWAFLMGTGVRIGELVSLTWDNVDLDERRVRIQQFTSTLGYDVVPSSSKSRDAVRTIDIDDHLVTILDEQRTQQAAESPAAGYKSSAYVFTKSRGGPYHPQYLSKVLGRISTEAGLPRLTAHGLRHTSATLMLASGVPPKVAAERLGHADAMLFINLYSHVTPTMQREAAALLGSSLFD